MTLGTVLRAVWRGVRIVLRLLCYLGLAFVASGIAALVFENATGGCPRLDEGEVRCNSPFDYSIGSYGLSVVYVSLFTGLPALLALAGLVLGLRDLRALLRRRAARR